VYLLEGDPAAQQYASDVYHTAAIIRTSLAETAV